MQGSIGREAFLKATVEKGHKPEYRQFYFKASDIRGMLGDEECLERK